MDESKKLARAEIEKIAAAALDEIIDPSVADLLKKVRPEDLVGTTPDAEVPKTTALPPTAWLESPGGLKLLAAAYTRLVRSAGPGVKHVLRVHAHFVKGTKLLVIRPAADNDLTAYEVRRYRSSAGAAVNLSRLLLEHKTAVETGWKERFEVAYIPKGSPLGAGLFINLDAVKERTRTSKKKDDEEQAKA